MQARELKPGVFWVGAVDWERRLFDELVPLDAGTTYNAYLVRGTEKTALIDTVDAPFTDALLARLDGLGVPVDYVVSNHAEQDHTGALRAVLERYPQAKVVATPKAEGMLADLLHVPADRIMVVADGATLPLGGRTLRFLHFPWVHTPETMLTFLEEDRWLFSTDLFGSHLAVGDPLVFEESRLLEEAKRTYACIMMPFRAMIAKHLPRVVELGAEAIAPGHGPVLTRPQSILDAYRRWTNEVPRNLAVLAYASTHDSTRTMVRHLAEALTSRGVAVEFFHLTDPDVGKLAMALVDAATIVLGSPVMLGGAHPRVAYAAYLTNALRPKARFASVIGSYGWGGKMPEQLVGLMPALKLEVLGPVLAKGAPRADDLAALERLAETIAQRHASLA